MKTFIPENFDSKREKIKQITQNLLCKSSGCYDGNSYYYDNEKYYNVDINYNI